MTACFFLFCFAAAAQKQHKRPTNWAKPVACSLDNFYQLNDSIYRSAQPTKGDFKCIRKNKIETLVCLRSRPYDMKLDKSGRHTLLHLSMQPDDFTDKEIIDALQLIKMAPKPMLIHCHHGSDRTGVVLAMYRIVFEDWSKTDAIQEMTKGGYGYHHKYDNIIRYILDADVEHIRKEVFEAS